MEEEFYFEESNPRKSKITFLIIIGIVALCLILFLVYRNRISLKIKKTVTYEAGDVISTDIADYVTSSLDDKKSYKLYLNNVTKDKENILTTTGEYTYKVKHKGVTKKGIIKVIDTKAPKVKTTDMILGVGEEIVLDDFIESCEDYSKPCTLVYKNEKDAELTKKAGTYEIDFIVSDTEGNKVTRSAKLVVKKGYDSKESKKKDLEASYIDPNYDEWNGEMVIKFTEGVEVDSIDDEDPNYQKLLDLSSENLHNYLDPMYANNGITETQVIEVFNKYDYCIGYAMLVKLDNGLSFFLTK